MALNILTRNGKAYIGNEDGIGGEKTLSQSEFQALGNITNFIEINNTGQDGTKGLNNSSKAWEINDPDNGINPTQYYLHMLSPRINVVGKSLTDLQGLTPQSKANAIVPTGANFNPFLVTDPYDSSTGYTGKDEVVKDFTYKHSLGIFGMDQNVYNASLYYGQSNRIDEVLGKTFDYTNVLNQTHLFDVRLGLPTSATSTYGTSSVNSGGMTPREP